MRFSIPDPEKPIRGDISGFYVPRSILARMFDDAFRRPRPRRGKLQLKGRRPTISTRIARLVARAVDPCARRTPVKETRAVTIPLLAPSVIRAVTFTALFGMLLGAIFGYLAGMVAPGLFLELQATPQDPEATGLVLGAFGGVLCGGLLGAFAVVVQAFGMWLDVRHRERSS